MPSKPPVLWPVVLPVVLPAVLSKTAGGGARALRLCFFSRIGVELCLSGEDGAPALDEVFQLEGLGGFTVEGDDDFRFSLEEGG